MLTPEGAATTHRPKRPGGAEFDQGARLGTRKRASYGPPSCRENATCVRDPGRCERPDGRRGCSSVPGCGPTSGVVRGSPAGRTRAWKKRFCCVTTRRRNVWLSSSLRRRLGPLAAHALGLGVLGFRLGALATLGLPPRRLPATDLPPAFRLLAVTLVPTPRLVLAPAPLAQADSRASSSPSGQTGARSLNLASAHGRCYSLVKPGENASTFSSGAYQNEVRAVERQSKVPRRNKTENQTILEMRLGRKYDQPPCRLPPHAQNWLRIVARSHN